PPWPRSAHWSVSIAKRSARPRRPLRQAGRRMRQYALSQRHHDLADLLVRLEVFVGGGNFLETVESFRDHGPEMPAGEPRQNGLLRGLVAVRVVPDFAGDPPAHRQAFEGAGPMGVGRRLLAQPAVNE